jgi:hypothetical protein
VVPPNTRATVELPGVDETPIDVGSGNHTWSYELPPAAAADDAVAADVGDERP